MSDEDLFLMMVKVYRGIGRAQQQVNRDYCHIWEGAGSKIHLRGISLEQALRKNGHLEPEVQPPVTEAGALEYDEIMEIQKYAEAGNHGHDL